MWILVRLAVAALFIAGKLPHPGIVLLKLVNAQELLLSAENTGAKSFTFFQLLVQGIHYLTGIGLYICLVILIEIVVHQLIGARAVTSKSHHG